MPSIDLTVANRLNNHLNTVNMFTKAMNYGVDADLCFVDFLKAFHDVNHIIRCAKLFARKV